MASNMPHKYTVQYDHSSYETTTNIIRWRHSRIKSASELATLWRYTNLFIIIITIIIIFFKPR